MAFEPASFPLPTPSRYLESFSTVWEHLAKPGAWLSAADRVRVAEAIRSAVEPAAIPADLPDDELLLDTVRRITQVPFKLHRGWFDQVTDRLGLGVYAELAALVAQVVPIDRFCALVGRELEPLPDPGVGDPTREVSSALVDRGAWLPMAPMPGANVAAALSYVELDNLLRLGVVRAMYSGTEFGDLEWHDRALSRPQIELLAARTSSHNKCFY